MTQRKMPIAESEVSAWAERISAVEDFLDEEILPRWRDILSDYEGLKEHDRNSLVTPESGVNFNFLLATANSLLPSIVSTNPYIRAKPRRPGDEETAKVAEATVNYVWREIRALETTQEAALDALLFNLGVGKVSYDDSDAFLMADEYERGPTQGTEETQLDDQQRRTLLRMMAEVDIPIASDSEDDMPVFNRIAPWNLLVPLGYDKLRKAPWVAERIPFMLDDLRNDGRFKVPKALEADSWVMDSIPTSLAGNDPHNRHSQPDTAADHVMVYEIRYWARVKDTMQRRILWIVKPRDGLSPKDCVLRHINDPMDISGYPYRTLSFVRIPGKLYTTTAADLAIIQEPSSRLNTEWNYLLNHHERSSKRKFVALQGALEGGQLTALLESGIDLEVAELPVATDDIRKVVMLLPEAPPPSTTMTVLQGLQRMMYELSGVDVYQRGGVGRKGTTATEVSVAAQGSNSRAGVRLAAVEQFMEDISRVLLSVVAQYWDEPRHMRVIGESGQEGFETFDSSKVGSSYDVNIEAGSAIGKDPAEEAQAYIGLLSTIDKTLETFGQLAQLGMVDDQTVRSYLEKAFSLWQANSGLMSPLGQLVNAGTAGASGGGGPGLPAPSEAELAGGGPRPGAGQAVPISGAGGGGGPFGGNF